MGELYSLLNEKEGIITDPYAVTSFRNLRSG
jgi:hypothetical protein